MTKKTNEPSGWNPVFEFPLDDRNTIIIDGVKYKRVEAPKSIRAQRIMNAFTADWQDEPIEQDKKCLANAIRALVEELKYIGITEKNILELCDELEWDEKDNPKPKPKTLYEVLHRLYRNCNGLQRIPGLSEICDATRGYLIDHSTIETEDADMVTFTIHKAQLQVPNNDY